MSETRRALLAGVVLVIGCLSGGCVTDSGGAGQAVTALGTVVLVSQVAQDAASGEERARLLWCGTLTRVARQIGEWQGRAYSESELTEALTQEIYVVARNQGYALHRQQVGQLIADAARVDADPAAKAEAAKACPAPPSP